MVDNADAHRIDQRIAFIAFVEYNLAAYRRDPDAVAVTGNAGYHVLKQIFNAIALELAETKRVQNRYRSCPMEKISRIIPPTPVVAP